MKDQKNTKKTRSPVRLPSDVPSKKQPVYQTERNFEINESSNQSSAPENDSKRRLNPSADGDDFQQNSNNWLDENENNRRDNRRRSHGYYDQWDDDH